MIVYEIKECDGTGVSIWHISRCSLVINSHSFPLRMAGFPVNDAKLLNSIKKVNILCFN